VSSPYDDGWLAFDLLAIEIRLNDPRTVSERETIEHAAKSRKLEGRDQTQLATEPGTVGHDNLQRRELATARASSSSASAGG
jgi:hypothetical protein